MKPQPMSPCVFGLGFITLRRCSSYWSKQDNVGLCVICSIPVISDGGDIKVTLRRITLKPLYYPCNLFEMCLVDLCVGA